MDDRYVCSEYQAKRIREFYFVQKDEVEYYVEKQIESALQHDNIVGTTRKILE
jgi:hypothetical protein